MLQGVMPEAQERAIIQESTATITKHDGQPPKGWLGAGLSESSVGHFTHALLHWSIPQHRNEASEGCQRPAFFKLSTPSTALSRLLLPTMHIQGQCTMRFGSTAKVLQNLRMQ